MPHRSRRGYRPPAAYSCVRPCPIPDADTAFCPVMHLTYFPLPYSPHPNGMPRVRHPGSRASGDALPPRIALKSGGHGGRASLHRSLAERDFPVQGGCGIVRIGEAGPPVPDSRSCARNQLQFGDGSKGPCLSRGSAPVERFWEAHPPRIRGIPGFRYCCWMQGKEISGGGKLADPRRARAMED